MDRSTDLDAIIIGCKKGHQDAFEKLVNMYSTRCYGYFYRLTGNATQSEDLLSELFLRLVKKIGSFKSEKSSFERWLFTTAANLFRDQLRVKYQKKKFFDTKTAQLAEKHPLTHSESQIIDKMQINLEKLDPATRELLLLRFYGGFSFKELAKMRSEPIGTTLAKVHRGLKKLKELMERDND